MPNRVGSDYKLRSAWDELRRHTLVNRPHVEAFLASKAGRFLIDHVQNFCWTVERLSERSKPETFDATAKAIRTADASSAAEAGGEGPRIYLDITNTSRSKLNTGIQRVCRRLSEEGGKLGVFQPVKLRDGELHSISTADDNRIFELEEGDLYVIIDTFWDPIDEYLSFIAKARARGVVIATCFHDILPCIHPEICAVEFGPIFNGSINRIFEVSDICLAVSKATLDDLKGVLSKTYGRLPPEKAFFYFHLGADNEPGTRAGGETGFPDRVAADPMFLSVGTVEPKKGYALTLDAFDDLWAAGHAINLVIIGKYGWGASAVRERIKHHPQFDKRLFWFQRASDAFLYEAYERCYAFIQASVAEGFGIPIIEAARRGVPVIASDIDVFKEIAGDNLIYFASENVASLERRLVQVLHERPVPVPWSMPSWQASVIELNEGLISAWRDVQARRRAE